MHLIDAISEGLELVLKRLEERIQPLPTLLGKALLLTIKDLIRKVLKLLFKLLLVLLEQLELLFSCKLIFITARDGFRQSRPGLGKLVPQFAYFSLTSNMLIPQFA